MFLHSHAIERGVSPLENDVIIHHFRFKVAENKFVHQIADQVAQKILCKQGADLGFSRGGGGGGGGVRIFKSFLGRLN